MDFHRMKALNLELSGYKYLRFNHIKKIKIDFDNLIQIILGKNGSGKSKLLKEISPLPAIPKDYEKKGYKIYECEYNGHQYKLVSDFSSKKPHSFLKDGEELNAGGTISVQREIVQRELRYTNEVHDLILGKMKFTEMPPVKRREFLQNISDCDVTYAMGIFKKVLSAERDARGASRELKKTLKLELEKLTVLETDHENIKEKVKLLREEIEFILPHIDPKHLDNGRINHVSGFNPAVKEHEMEDTQRAMQQISKQLIEEIQQLKDMFHLDKDYSELDMDTLDSKSQTLRENILVKRSYIDNVGEEFENIQKLMKGMEDTGVGDIDELKSSKEALSEEIKRTLGNVSTFTFKGDVTPFTYAMGELKVQLVDVLSILPDNSDKRFSKENLTKVETAIEEDIRKLNKCKNMMDRIHERMDHIRNSENNECPKCNYTWIPGVSPRELEELNGKLTGLDKVKRETEVTLKSKQEYREGILEYGGSFKKFRTIFDNYPWASGLFDYLLEEGRIYYTPSDLIPIVDVFANDLDLHAEVWKLKLKELAMEDALLKLETTEVKGGANDLQKHLSSMENRIYETERELEVLDVELNTMRTFISKLERVQSLDAQFYETYELMLEQTRLFAEDRRQTTLMGIHQKCISDLGYSNEIYENTKNHESRISGLNENLKQLENKTKVLKLLAKALSPNEGLIARSMGSFVDRFITKLNNVIGGIYTYGLIIFNSPVGDDGLTYTFPMEVNDMSDMTPSDVSEGSEGQRELIDFAFRLVALSYMGYEDYPMCLDEIGRAQDEVHKSNLMDYVRNLAYVGGQQIFLVSHFASAHTAFNNADFIVLNTSNITTPNKINQNVECT